eukprot:GEZU01027240.1.p1 GENE.GEZU01027240.1~~GEZU01027240.1.p1  ORF type:complete len:188 (+),score=24.74 GEZU01027240.1:253-816(+)
MKITPHMKKIIKECESHGNGTTTSSAKNHLQNLGIFSNKQLPKDKSIASLLSYERNKRWYGMNDVQAVRQLIADPKNRPYLLRATPISRKESWYVIFATATGLYDLREYGKQNVALDSCYKFARYRYPLWVLVAKDHTGTGTPCLFIYGSASRADILEKAVKDIRQELQERYGVLWNPLFTIDRVKK